MPVFERDAEIEKAVKKLPACRWCQTMLKSKRDSSNTIKTYTEALRTFLKYYAAKPSSHITNEDLIQFNMITF